jgi:RimJ/RimL family protein N-acetyltransferase
MRLREVRDDDLDAFFAHQDDREASELAGVPMRERAAFDDHWQRIRTDPATVIRTIDADGEVAGYIFTFVHEGERVVGYCLGREFWGRGLATNALADFLDVVDERPLRATVTPANRASVRVLEKNGFRLLREGPEDLAFELS